MNSPIIVSSLLLAASLLLVATARADPSATPTTVAPKVDAPISLSSIMPKLEAIHEDAQNLLIKNSELKAKILAGLQVQTEAKLKLAKEALRKPPQTSGSVVSPGQGGAPYGATTISTVTPSAGQADPNAIDYAELEEFNKWVDANLEYAVKNVHASIEALKEEAEQNNGMVDYTEQAVKDGIEGVKYWQSAVIFQDKTLKNEKYEADI